MTLNINNGFRVQARKESFSILARLRDEHKMHFMGGWVAFDYAP